MPAAPNLELFVSYAWTPESCDFVDKIQGALERERHSTCYAIAKRYAIEGPLQV
jgi:hypothetical protein